MSRRQAECLAAIKRHIETHNYSPSFFDLMLVMGVTSPNGISCHVNALVRKGYLRRSARQARTLVPID